MLPKGWDKLTYRFKYQNGYFEVVVKKDKFTVQLLTEEIKNSLWIWVNERKVEFKDNSVLEFEVKND
nr:glycosyl hydrolase family 65 protein [Mycoplasmopsis edwardii]